MKGYFKILLVTFYLLTSSFVFAQNVSIKKYPAKFNKPYCKSGNCSILDKVRSEEVKGNPNITKNSFQSLDFSVQEGPRLCQEGQDHSKTAPRDPETDPRRPRKFPKPPQEAPRLLISHGAPKELPSSSKTHQRGPESFEEVPKDLPKSRQ